MADRNYDSSCFQFALSDKEVELYILPTRSSNLLLPHGKPLYRQHHPADSMFAKLKG